MTDHITIPIDVAEAAAEAIGNFVSDHGWLDSDMQAMDNLISYTARHKANQAALAAQPQTLDEAMAVPRAMAQAYENGYNAALANGPAWHDAPDKPGIWLCDEGDICYTWTAHSIEILDIKPEDDARWFGPIPQDGEKS